MRAWVDVAVLARARNSKGSFAVKATAGLPFLLEEGMEVALVPPLLEGPRRVHVVSVAPTGDNTAEVTFAEVDSIAVAKELAGCHCLVRRDEIDSSALAEPSAFWEGWRVVDDELGDLGAVAAVIENPGQALIEVDCAPSLKREAPLYVPAVDEIVYEVDTRAHVLRVALPSGLIDL